MFQNIKVFFDAETGELKAKLEGVQKETKKTKGSLDKLVPSMAQLQFAGVAAFAAIGTAAVASVKAFSAFDNQLRGVKTLLNESSFGAKGLDKGFKDLTDQVLDLASKTPVAIDSLNKALFDTISAGIDAGDSIEFLGSAAKLSVAGLTDVSTATNGLTNIVNAFSLEAEDATKVAAALFGAQRAGKTTVEELSNSIGTVATTAREAGLSYQELLAATSALTVAAVPTNTAFVGLKAAISNINKPTADAVAEAKRLEIQFDATALRTLRLGGFLDQITNSAKFNKDSLTKLFGSTQALTIAQTLAGSQAEKYKEILSDLNDETNLVSGFNDAAVVSGDSLENTYKTLANSIKVLSIKLGEDFAPAAKLAAKAITELALVIGDDAAEKNKIVQLNVLRAAYAKLQHEADSFRKFNTDTADEVDAQAVILKAKIDRLDAEINAEAEGIRASNELKELQKEKLLEDDLAEDEKNKTKALKKKAVDDKALKDKESGLTAHKKKLQKIESTALTTKEQVKWASDRKLRAAEIKENNLRLTEEQKIGKELAAAKAFFRRAEVKQTQQLLSVLTTLGASGNKALGRIAQAAAVTQAIINTAVGATKAIAEGGPFLGPALAAATIAAGAVQIATIKNQKFAQGGIVGGGISGVDSVPIVAQRGELISPRTNFDEVIGSVRAGREAEKINEGGGASGNVELTFGVKDDFIEIIEQKIVERQNLGISILGVA